MNQGQCWRELGWDSETFGISVARIDAPDLDTDALAAALAQAKAQGVQLMYWLAERPSCPSAPALHALGGVRVDERVTYVQRLGPNSPSGRRPGPAQIQRYLADEAEPALIRLGIAAGERSRFANDTRLGRARFELAYTAWTKNCVAGGMAEAVYVSRAASGELTGMVTINRVDDGSAARSNIGLIAVAEQARGQGLGRALVSQALVHARAAKHSEAQVVTQRSNLAACALYAKCGYHVESQATWFHFWL